MRLAIRAAFGSIPLQGDSTRCAARVYVGPSYSGREIETQSQQAAPWKISWKTFLLGPDIQIPPRGVTCRRIALNMGSQMRGPKRVPYTVFTMLIAQAGTHPGNHTDRLHRVPSTVPPQSGNNPDRSPIESFIILQDSQKLYLTLSK